MLFGVLAGAQTSGSAGGTGGEQRSSVTATAAAAADAARGLAGGLVTPPHRAAASVRTMNIAQSALSNVARAVALPCLREPLRAI